MKKKFIHVLVLSAVLTSASGCGAWWQDFKNNPAAQIAAFEQSIQTALNIAMTIWTALHPYLSADVLKEAQPKYEKAMLAANKAMIALSDAEAVAVQAGEAHPDFSVLMQKLTDAAAQVTAIVLEYKNAAQPSSLVPGVTPKPAEGIAGYEELDSAMRTVKRVGGTK